MMHVPKPIYLSIPKRHRKIIRMFYKRGLRNSKMKPWDMTRSPEQIVEDFRLRYTSPPETWTHVDGVMDWYLAPLYHFESSLKDFENTPETQVADIGCGPASVCRWLRSQDYEWSYTGYDPVEACAPYFNIYENAEFVAKAAEEMTVDDFKKAPDLITAVNAFCYIQKPLPVLRLLREVSHKNTNFILVDAHPSPFWTESMLGGHRTPSQIYELLHASGWALERQSRLSAHVIFNRPFITISQAYLCSPK